MKKLAFLPLMFVILMAHSQTNVFPPSGFAGIGTISPISPLHIQGNDPDLTLDINSGSTVADAPELRFSLDGIQKASVFWSKLDNKLYLRNNNNTLLMDSIGSVGLGTSHPISLFHMQGDDPDLTLDINSGSTVADAPELRFSLDGIQKAAVFWSKLDEKLYMRNNNNILLMNSSGDVGIGTTIPDAKLTVNGDIHAREVRVDLTVPGPDYVFEEEYDLPTLESLQSYISANKHLPGVPSARDMEEYGIDLGIMNMLLLKKVEELTLYTLEQEKKINQLEKEKTSQWVKFENDITDLQRLINELKKALPNVTSARPIEN